MGREEMEIFAEYTRIRQPDRDKLAELIMRAKGDGRTMRQFAEDCGVSPSTLSRVVNKKTIGANSDELIDAVYRNADPESGITLEMLLDAHGMVPRLRNGRTKRFEHSLLEKNIQDIILMEIIDRGFDISLPKEDLLHSALNYPHKSDYALYTNAVGEKRGLWEFEIWTLAFMGKAGEQVIQRQVMRLRQKILMCLGMMYMGEMKCSKLSFVVTEEEVYEKLTESVKGCKLPDAISIILISLEENRILDEYQMPLKSGEIVPSILDTPKFEYENEKETDASEEDISEGTKAMFEFADHDII